ncbi:MAG: CoA pyrophosphatase [Syntrophorhabdaceae bacterium]|nr:CoA pyrophosphatase [Syntrophorhabdaceae bacterium]MDD4196919.1 CoA pyrophosphatase [Syntrophorhabdaceae bacterium]HOC45107.1 CoA pyrophosphatase [Syntrophorhabdaceae bacterium]
MLDIIKQSIMNYRPRRIPFDEDIRAAVALLLLEREGEVFTVLTKRTETVRHHKGEVSFPGGMFEPGDLDLESTALRESHEEIGIDPGCVEIIGSLDDSWTYTGFIITPYVGIVNSPYELITNPREVAYLIFLPYSHLKDDRFSPVKRGPGWTSFRFNGDRIWGATCRVLMHFRDIIENETF